MFHNIKTRFKYASGDADEFEMLSKAMILAVMDFSNCVEKPQKFRTSMGFEPVTSRYQCDALYREVTGSNLVEVLNFSGFSTQLLKLRPYL